MPEEHVPHHRRGEPVHWTANVLITLMGAGLGTWLGIIAVQTGLVK